MTTAERQLRYSASEKGRAAMARYRASTKGKAARKRDPRDPAKVAARRAVNAEIAAGRLVRGPCRVCGDPKTEAHHFLGYEPENALAVWWLCKLDHNREHGRSRS